jgi:transcriptional regulator with XRE-family HTH domain
VPPGLSARRRWVAVADNRSAARAAGTHQLDEDTPAGPVTIAYIAESAGVSAPTVSEVLNGRKGVSDDTRARIEELINRYGYRKPPNRSNILELVFRELKSMWAVEISRGVEQVARRNRVGVMVSESSPYVVVWGRPDNAASVRGRRRGPGDTF